MRISDWSSDVCSSDLTPPPRRTEVRLPRGRPRYGPRLPRRTGPRRHRRTDVAYRVSTRSCRRPAHALRSEEHTSELQSLMRISYAVFCLKKTHTSSYQQHRTPLHRPHLSLTPTQHNTPSIIYH